MLKILSGDSGTEEGSEEQMDLGASEPARMRLLSCLCCAGAALAEQGDWGLRVQVRDCLAPSMPEAMLSVF